MCQNHRVFFSQSGGGDHFRVHGSDVTITVCSACAQKFVAARARKAVHQIPNTEDTPPEPLQQKTVWGIYIYIYSEQMSVSADKRGLSKMSHNTLYYLGANREQ